MPSVYQLRAVLRDVSPLIWRRLLVRSDTSIGALHACLQAAIGWSDIHLHRFRILGKAYGIARCGGISFVEDALREALDGFEAYRRFQPKHFDRKAVNAELRGLATGGGGAA
jgi:hypothetical protein